MCVCVCNGGPLYESASTKISTSRPAGPQCKTHYMRHSCLESRQQPKNKRKVWNVPEVQNCHSNLSVTVSTAPKFCDHLPLH